MNRTFSLNNVNQQQQHQPQQHPHKIVEIDFNKTSSSSSSSTSSTSSASSPTSINHNNNELKQQQQTLFSPKSTTSSTNSTIHHHHPKRRTPRNAEEFLEAAGIDSDYFANKGYYVGSMYNLNQIGGSSQQPPIIKTETVKNKPQRSLSLLKRNSSLKETSSSMSLANLNLFNHQQASSSNGGKKFTDLSLFNEYFIDKTYKYVNNQKQQNDDGDEQDVKNVVVKNEPTIIKPTTNGKKNKNKIFFHLFSITISHSISSFSFFFCSLY